VESQLSQITNMLNKLVAGGVQSVVTYNICCLEGHISDACPHLQGGGMLMLCFLIRAKENMTLILVPITRDGGIILTLGMDLDLIPLV